MDTASVLASNHPTTDSASLGVAWTPIPTQLGELGLVWGPAGLRSVLLPGGDVSARVRDGHPTARRAQTQPTWVERLGQQLSAHLSGDTQSFDDVPLDLGNLTEFQRAVLDACRAIPAGQVLTYGELAARLERPNAARAVGGALSRNPVPLVVPCHRVVGRGRPGGFTAPGGLGTKEAILSAEGVALR